jgi:hypothetical protein
MVAIDSRLAVLAVVSKQMSKRLVQYMEAKSKEEETPNSAQGDTRIILFVGHEYDVVLHVRKKSRGALHMQLLV